MPHVKNQSHAPCVDVLPGVTLEAGLVLELTEEQFKSARVQELLKWSGLYEVYVEPVEAPAEVAAEESPPADAPPADAPPADAPPADAAAVVAPTEPARRGRPRRGN